MLCSVMIFISDSVGYRDKRFSCNFGGTQLMVCSQTEFMSTAGGRESGFDLGRLCLLPVSVSSAVERG